MKTSIRCESLDMSDLAGQEAHGKRLDWSSQQRIINDDPPLVWGDPITGLNLRDLYDQHMDGVKLNKSAKKTVLHFVVRFPPPVLHLDEGAGRFVGDKIERQAEMLRQAVELIQQTHGGDAVFAARVDRDEAGETIVDIFATPKYAKRTKRTKPDEQGAIWASATKFGKDLAVIHEDEIRRRHPRAKPGKLTGPRMIGIALNSEFRLYFERENGLKLDPKIEKDSSSPDRLEIEAYKRVQGAKDAAALDIEAVQDDLERLREDVRLESAALDRIAADKDQAARDLDVIRDKARCEQEAADRVAADTIVATERLDGLRAAAGPLERLIERVRGVLTAVGEIFGTPLPGALTAGVKALEAEILRHKAEAMAKAQIDITDPFAAGAVEVEPEVDDDQPSFGM